MESQSPERSPNIAKCSSNTFLDDFIAAFTTNTGNSLMKGETFKTELQRWMIHSNLSLSVLSDETWRWWRATITFPQVKIMTQDYLAVTATSVPSERVFSHAGDIVNKKRASLGDDAVEALKTLQS